MTPASELRLHVLDGGNIHATGEDAASMTDDGAYDGRVFDMPVPSFLIRHPDGALIWDTGMSRTRTDLGAWSTPGPSMVDQLAALGLLPADIGFLSLSHGHWDHSGNAGLFAGATWIVNPLEREVMFSDEERATASMDDYGALEYAATRLIADDHDVFGDGSVVIIQAPGHTIGHACLLVRLPDGPVLLSGDLWHLAENRTHRRQPTFNVDRAQTLASMDRVEALVRAEGARVVIQHDAGDIAALQAR